MSLRNLLAIIGLGILSSACAGITTSQVDIEVDTIANPSNGHAVTIAQVLDKREFRVAGYGEGAGASIGKALLVGPYLGQAVAKHGRVPSLESIEDFNNPKMKARAFGRLYGGYGNPLGNILLPAGKTVAQIIRKVLEDSLRQSGYRVVKKDSKEGAGALVLNAEVLDYWAWTEGIIYKHYSRIKLLGPWPGSAGNAEHSFQTQEQSLAPSEGTWRGLVKSGHSGLIKNLKLRLN